MRRCGLTLAIAILYAAVWAPAAEPAASSRPAVDRQWMAVTTPELREVLEPLRRLRERQGFRVTVVTEWDRARPGQDLRDKILAAHRGFEGQTMVLILGAGVADENTPQSMVVPTLTGSVERMKDQPTDNGYGCLDDTVLPTAAVGRMPARSVAEARAMVNKTLAWSQESKPGPWKRRMLILAGSPRYNKFVDALVERMAMTHLSRIDPTWSGRAVYRNAASTFHLPDDVIRTQTIDYLQADKSLTVYMGHSSPGGFWFGTWGRIFGRDEWAKVRMPLNGGIFFTFACSGCSFGTGRRDGYGLYAIRNPHGPVAVGGAYMVDWAAMAMLFSEGLFHQLPKADESPYLADIWLGMQRHLAEGPLKPIVFRTLDQVDGSPGTPEQTQRLEHLEMFQLFGDPAIRLHGMTTRLPLTVAGRVHAGETLTVEAEMPKSLRGAKGVLSLERTLTSAPLGIETLPDEGNTDARRDVFKRNHERSNDFVLDSVKVKVRNDLCQGQLEIPDTLPWSKVIVRLTLANEHSDGMGVKVMAVTATAPGP